MKTLCKCYQENDFDFYPAVILGIASEWTVTEHCPIHGKGGKMEPQKIYIVMEGCQYEGCAIVSIHATEGGAFAAAEDIVKTSRYRNYTKDTDGDGALHRWSDSTDLLLITTREVKA